MYSSMLEIITSVMRSAQRDGSLNNNYPKESQNCAALGPPTMHLLAFAATEYLNKGKFYKNNENNSSFEYKMMLHEILYAQQKLFLVE